MTKSVSLEAKRAYIRKTRRRNYITSMRLEGINVDDRPLRYVGLTKAELIAMYKDSKETEI